MKCGPDSCYCDDFECKSYSLEEFGRELEAMEEDQIVWTGDLSDDCVAYWQGLTLRAEDMGGWWWWQVYDDKTSDILCDCYGQGMADTGKLPPRRNTGKRAREAAEEAARRCRGNEPR